MDDSKLIACERCQTPLHTSLDVSDPYILKTQLMASHHMLRGDGYALNAFCDKGRPTCPICGFQLEAATFKGNSPFNLGKPISCEVACGDREIEFLKRHARVHLRADLSMMGGRRPSREYLFAHVALRHFIIGGTVSVFNHAIGPMAILNSETSKGAIQYLCEIVGEATNQSLSPNQFQVEAFAIQCGACVVIKMPTPKEIAEAHLVGIFTNAPLESTSAESTPAQIDVLYFTLELSREQLGLPRTMLGEWKYNNRRNYGYGPNPVVGNFVECIERVGLSRIWQ